MKSNGKACCGFCLLFTGVLLIIILVPLTFSYVEYYEYGLAQRKTTGSVDTVKVYSSGRYNLGPTYGFHKYQADAHHESLDELQVFSKSLSNESIGLEFRIDVDFTYFLNKDEVGALHRELASSYRNVILSRTKDGIKNEAIFVTFNEYFQDRKAVEQRFKEAVQSRWNQTPSVHAMLDQFHLGRIQIPNTVAKKQLESKIQNERNGREDFLQKAQLEREATAVEVNQINLEANKITRTATANANLIVANAQAEAVQIKSNADIFGTTLLFENAGIELQEEKISFSYIRSLMKRENVDLTIDYLSGENILKTKAVV
jgi:hypothetical protein|eukprot:CAMPEP_0198283966 /NCGR_PEP_ID=MMETSP1449-20131203/3539_1 /TAXON_ID=420275 /ORGANISM="Attheya septentrionalis, Strain CCMP2084" /LENGTH=315 /DNA_ID=CAMNT_0043980871 /DNA_START=163 /DNA_END=1110 /DNA_ORIENTATION=+